MILYSKEWIRVGVQIFITLILFIITRKKENLKDLSFFR